MLAGKGDGDVSENDFVDKIMHRFEGHGSSLTTTVKNDPDWEPFKSSPFSQKVFFGSIHLVTYTDHEAFWCRGYMALGVVPHHRVGRPRQDRP